MPHEELSLKNKVDIKLCDFIGKSEKNASIILMHPNSAMNFVDEVWVLNKRPFNVPVHNIIYGGIRIIRSEDIKEGEIEIY